MFSNLGLYSGHCELHVIETRFYNVPLKYGKIFKQVVNLAEAYQQNICLHQGAAQISVS